MKKYFYFIFFLISLNLVLGNNYLNFTEDFNTAWFHHTRNATIVGPHALNYTTYSTGQLTNFSSITDHEWRYLQETDVSGTLESGWHPTYHNTNQSLTIGLGYTGSCANCEHGLGTIFEQPYSLLPDSNISFYCGSSTAGASMSLVFGNSDSRVILPYHNMLCTNDIVNGNPCCEDLHTLIGNNCTRTNSMYHVNLKLQDIIDYCPNNLTKYMFEDLTYMAFESTKNGGSAITNIDDIKIEFFNGSNSFPTYNVTLEDYYRCVLENETFPQEINLSWEVYDLEGDTIYYGYGYSGINSTATIDFGDIARIGPIEFPYMVNYKYDVADTNFYFSCDLSYEKNNEENHTNLVRTYDVYGEDSIGLELNGNCGGNKYGSFYYLPEIANAVYHSIELTSFDNDEALNISLFDPELDEYGIEINLAKTNNIYVLKVSEDGNNFYQVDNVTSSGDKIVFGFGNTVTDANNYHFRFWYNSGNDIPNTASLSNYSMTNNVQEFGHIEYKINDGDKIILDRSYTTLKKYDIDWTTDQPGELTFYKEGSSQIVFFVSDGAHYPDTYDQTVLNVKIDQREYCFDALEDTVTDNLIGNNFNNFIDFLNIRTEFRKLLYIAYVVLTLIFIVTIYKASHYVRIPLASFIASICCFAIAYLAREATAMISFIILMTLSFIGTVMQR